MRLTSLCVHVLGALAYLARHEGQFVAAATLADARGLSGPYLGKALKPLVAAGALRAGRGPRGGYRLARAARDITLLEVVEAVDRPVRGEAPRFGGDARLDARLQGVCDRAAEAVRRQLRKVSIADLAGE